MRDARWSEGVAVGSLAFVEKVKGIHRSNGKFFPRILDDATRFEASCASDDLNDWNGAKRWNVWNVGTRFVFRVKLTEDKMRL
jgi:hypothetical protein